jgi:hypothetical protein
MLLDGGIGEHWPDLLVAAFIAVVGYLLRRAIGSVDDRQAAADREAKDQGKTIADHSVTLGKHEVRLDNMDKAARHQRSED